MVSSPQKQDIEHSENKSITYFENEVEPGVVQSSVERTCTQEEFHIKLTESKCNHWPTLFAFGILAAVVFVERGSGAFQV